MAAPPTPTCTQPYDSGSPLCKVCRLAPPTDGLRRCSRMVVESPVMKTLMTRAATIATADASVLIYGESGTGKEMLARTLHANGPRKGKAFVAVNVAAIPAELLESELFGHARGAFTGAVATKKGLFEVANGGTLLLDEMGEMPFSLQAKLLRVLQDGEVRRVGETDAIHVDVRILCATHRDLEDRVAQGLFREDLYYRLKVFTLTVPPLRERVPDILPLAHEFLRIEGHGGELTAESRRALEAYQWPGNVRELANVVKHGVVLSHGEDIAPEHLPEELSRPTRARARGVLRSLAEVEEEHITRVLEALGGNQVEASRVLGIARNTLWRKLKAYGIGGPRAGSDDRERLSRRSRA